MRIQSYHLHLPHLHIDSNKNLRRLYGLRVVRDVVNKLAFLLFPIFLYETGSALALFPNVASEVQGFLFVSVYFSIYYGFSLLCSIPVANIIGKIGYNRVMVQAYLIRSVSFILLYFSHQSPWFLLPAVLLDAFQSQMYWISYHTLLSKNTLKNHMGSDLGALQLLLQLIAAVTPAIAGIIAVKFGLHYLFLVGVVGPLIAAIVAMTVDVKHERDKVSVKELKSWLKEPEFRQLSLANAGRVWNDLALYFWPLYLFFILGALDKVGYIQSVGLFLAMLMTFFIAPYLDRNKSKKPFLFSGSVLAVVWGVRAFIASVWHITFSDVVDRLTGNFHWLYFDAIFFRRGKGSQALSYFTYRELVVSASALVFYAFFFAAFYFGIGWWVMFGFAVIGSVASLFISQKHEDRFIKYKK